MIFFNPYYHTFHLMGTLHIMKENEINIYWDFTPIFQNIYVKMHLLLRGGNWGYRFKRRLFYCHLWHLRNNNTFTNEVLFHQFDMSIVIWFRIRSQGKAYPHSKICFFSSHIKITSFHYSKRKDKEVNEYNLTR